MENEIHIILQSILDEQKELRNDIKQVRAEQATKEDLKALNSEMDANIAKCAVDRVQLQKNTDFISEFLRGTKYVLGCIFVALMSFLIPTTLSAHSSPSVSRTQVIVQPLVQSIHPPTPDFPLKK